MQQRIEANLSHQYDVSAAIACDGVPGVYDVAWRRRNEQDEFGKRKHPRDTKAATTKRGEEDETVCGCALLW